MQIFLPYKNIIEVAKCLDYRRLNKQIIECNWIVKGYENPNSRINKHPIVIMYKGYINFIEAYRDCLIEYRNNNITKALAYSELARDLQPHFLENQDWYFDNFKRRLYTKDPKQYAQFASLGESNTNYYYVNDKWKEYHV